MDLPEPAEDDRVFLAAVFLGFLLVASPAQPQSLPLTAEAETFAGAEDAPLDASAYEAQALALGFIKPVPVEPPPRFDWGNATRQSLLFLSIEHGYRMFQSKTRQAFAGPFFQDYFTSVRNISGWDDGDSKFTNYFGHPLQGAIAGYIQVQNDPAGIGQQFGRSSGYWKSRLRALAWSAAYSTQFEIGLYSEATLGNVGLKKGQAGYVDLVMTPIGGLGLMLAEDALDRLVVSRFESRTSNRSMQALYRSLFNPSRSAANLFRFKPPWHRDTRP